MILSWTMVGSTHAWPISRLDAFARVDGQLCTVSLQSRTRRHLYVISATLPKDGNVTSWRAAWRQEVRCPRPRLLHLPCALLALPASLFIPSPPPAFSLWRGVRAAAWDYVSCDVKQDPLYRDRLPAFTASERHSRGSNLTTTTTTTPPRLTSPRANRVGRKRYGLPTSCTRLGTHDGAEWQIILSEDCVAMRKPSILARGHEPVRPRLRPRTVDHHLPHKHVHPCQSHSRYRLIHRARPPRPILAAVGAAVWRCDLDTTPQ